MPSSIPVLRLQHCWPTSRSPGYRRPSLEKWNDWYSGTILYYKTKFMTHQRKGSGLLIFILFELFVNSSGNILLKNKFLANSKHSGHSYWSIFLSRATCLTAHTVFHTIIIAKLPAHDHEWPWMMLNRLQMGEWRRNACLVNESLENMKICESVCYQVITVVCYSSIVSLTQSCGRITRLIIFDSNKIKIISFTRILFSRTW